MLFQNYRGLGRQTAAVAAINGPMASLIASFDAATPADSLSATPRLLGRQAMGVIRWLIIIPGSKNFDLYPRRQDGPCLPPLAI